MRIKSLRCSELHTREINVPDCVVGQPCRRIYHIFLPRILCHGGNRRLDTASEGDSNYESTNSVDDIPRRLKEYDEYFEGHYYTVGTLPLVFCLHGFGSDSRSMMNFIPLADEFHFVLVLPEGLEKSFNAKDCCGYSLENNIDDIAFLQQIQITMTTEFNFLQLDYSYGIGHNNGAFLLTHALEQRPHLFRSIVPISGYTHRVDEIRSKLGADFGIGMMMHHSLDDYYVRPSGCCGNTHLPKCHGDVKADYCMSVLQFFDLWAGQINMCGTDDGAGLDGSGNDLIIGRSGGLAYSLSYHNQSKSTLFSLMPDTNDPQKIDALFKSNIPMSISYHVPNNTVVCLTTASPSCIANSTLCLYTNKGDFRNDLRNEFFMEHDAMEFIAREACSANGMLEVIPGSTEDGKKTKYVCACFVSGQGEMSEDYGGVFCSDPLNEDGTFKTLSSSHTTQSTTGAFDPAPNTVQLPNQDVAESPEEQNEEIVPTAPSSMPLSSPAVPEPTVDQNQSLPPDSNATVTLLEASNATVLSVTTFNQSAEIDMPDVTAKFPTTEHNHNNRHILWVFILLFVSFFTIMSIRRRSKLTKKETQCQDDDISLYSRPMSPYRDFFKKQNDLNTKDEGENDDCLSWRHKTQSETEVVNQCDKSSALSGGLDSSEWEEHCPPYRLTPGIREDVTREHIMDDFSFSNNIDSLDDDVSSQQSHYSHQAHTENILNVASSPASYLEPDDRKMLRRYRQQNQSKKHNAIQRRERLLHDIIADPAGKVDNLDNDLGNIEFEMTVHKSITEIL